MYDQGVSNHPFTVGNTITCLTAGPRPRQQLSADAFQTGALAICVFHQWFLIVLHDTDICRRLAWDLKCSYKSIQPHEMRFVFHQNHMRRRFFSDFIQLRPDSVVAVETYKTSRWKSAQDFKLCTFSFALSAVPAHKELFLTAVDRAHSWAAAVQVELNKSAWRVFFSNC